MNRRAFIQGLIGLASMPALSKYINVFRPSAVREGITRAADNTMQKGIEFYEAVIKRVMDEGTVVSESDRVRTYTHPDKPGINVDLNVGTGDTAVYFETDIGSRAGAEITTDIEMPRAGKELMEHEEVYRMGQGDDYYKDIDEEITGGVGSLEEWIKMKRGYAAGGRVGMWKGGVPKGLQAALRLIRTKFGDDAIRTADEVERPQGAIEVEETAQAVNDFNIRNPRVKMTGDENLDYDWVETPEGWVKRPGSEGAFYRFGEENKELIKKGTKGASETIEIWEDPVKVREAVDDIFPTGDYKMDAEMAAEALVENNPAAFGGKLIDDIDDATRSKIYGAVLEVVQSDLGKMLQLKRASKPTKTLEGIKNTGTINISDPNVAEEFARFMRETDPKGFKDLEQKVELSNFNPKGRKKNAGGGIIGLTNNPMTASNKAGVETLFERR